MNARGWESGPVFYEGRSAFLHWWPPSMVVLGLVVGLLAGPASSVALFLPAVVMALLLPWRFAVLDEGIALRFGFGKQRFLAKERITVRVGRGPTLLLPRRAERLGYPLTDGLIERRRPLLRSVLAEHGFDVAS